MKFVELEIFYIGFHFKENCNLHLITCDLHLEPAKKIFSEPRLRLTPDNSAKNTIITAVSCLDELLSKRLTKIYIFYC